MCRYESVYMSCDLILLRSLIRVESINWEFLTFGEHYFYFSLRFWQKKAACFMNMIFDEIFDGMSIYLFCVFVCVHVYLASLFSSINSHDRYSKELYINMSTTQTTCTYICLMSFSVLRYAFYFNNQVLRLFLSSCLDFA